MILKDIFIKTSAFIKGTMEENRAGYECMEQKKAAQGQEKQVIRKTDKKPISDDFETWANKHREMIRRENEFLGLCNKRFVLFGINYDPVYGYKDWNDVPILNDNEINGFFRYEMDRYSPVIIQLDAEYVRIGRAQDFFSDRASHFIDDCIALCKYALVYKTYHQVVIIYRRSGANTPYYTPLVIPQFFPFVKLAMIYEKRAEYDKAVDICIKAINIGLIEDGTKTKFPGRMEKLIKKCKKAEIDIRDKVIPAYVNSSFDEKLTEYEQVKNERYMQDIQAQQENKERNDKILRYRQDIDDHYDGLYDLYSVAGIEKMPVKRYWYPPNTGGGMQSPVGSIDYVLHMRAGQHSTNGRIDLALACLKKARDIMPISGIGWELGDYMRLVIYLLEDGQDDEAEKEWQSLTKNGLPSRTEYDREWFEIEKQKAVTKRLFELLQETLPDIAPKSFSGYIRMKNARSKNWLILVDTAKEKGIDIE